MCTTNMLLCIKCFIFALTVNFVRSSKQSPIVTISNGSPIQGIEQETVTKKTVTVFYGIPYAEAPIGDLRFARTVPKKPWNKIYEANNRPNTCFQVLDSTFINFRGVDMWNPTTNISEDCLYLNIWVPGKVDPKISLPVMAWTHGGAFFSGTSAIDIYDGSVLATEENVIVVSWNYRLGALGFLYADSPDAPGNMGLLDQLEALKWVHANIRFFGGDHDKITLFGESAGAGSTSLHTLSSLSRPYFKRFILESGAATNPWSVLPKEEALNNAKKLAENCKCNLPDVYDSKNLLTCLKGLPAETLLENDVYPEIVMQHVWAPIVDGYFLDKHPNTLFEEATFKQGEALMGFNSHEYNFFSIYFLSDIFDKNEIFTKSEFITSDEIFIDALERLLPLRFRSNPAVVNAILFEYSDMLQHGTTQERQDALDKLMGDYTFVCNLLEYAQKYTDAGNKVFVYYFTHISSQTPWPKWLGVMHADEIFFVFGEPLNDIKFKYTQEEKQLTRRFMRYWANFARTGDPNKNSDGSHTIEEWPEFGGNESYITMSTNHEDVQMGPRKRQCEFWLNYLPSRVNLTGYPSNVDRLHQTSQYCKKTD